MKFIVAAVLVIILTPLSGFGEVRILEVALARMVEQRNPVDPFLPPAYCEKDKNGSSHIPLVDSHKSTEVFFWNTLSSTTPETLRYTWHRKHESSWEIMAEVDISIKPSPGFRIWSSKQIRPFHRGEWMIVVSITDDPKQVLCISRFLVQ